MESKYEQIDDGKIKIEVTLPSEEVDETFESVYESISRNARIPGFRKGKAPRSVLESNFGIDFFISQATADLINAHSEQIVDDLGLVTFGDFIFEDDPALAEKGSDFTYSFTVNVTPEYDLSSYDPLEIEMVSPKPTDEEIDAQVDILRSYYIELKEVERPIKTDDIVEYSIKVSKDGQEIDDASSESKTYVVGSGSRVSFDENLLGAKVGDEVSFHAIGSEVGLDGSQEFEDFDVVVNIIKIQAKVQPELTDEWVKENADYDSVEELRKTIGESIAKQKEAVYERDFHEKCLDAIGELIEGKPTDAQLIECNRQVLANLYTQLQEQGITLDSYLTSTGKNVNQFYDEVEKQASLLAKQNIALDAIAKKQGFTMDDEELHKALADAEVDNIDEVIDNWKQQKRLSELRLNILRDKSAKYIYDNAIVSIISDGDGISCEEESTSKGSGEDDSKTSVKTENTDFTKMKIAELKDYAKEHEIGLKGASKKAEIIAAIESSI